jgi:mannosylglucosylglycerate synthase
MNDKKRIGIISTRLAGTDGVSLETAKWVKVLISLGHDCFFFTGESEWPDEYTFILPEAHFLHPQIRELNIDLFNDFYRADDTSNRVSDLKVYIKANLHKFIEKFKPDLLIAENVLSLPMNVPLGLALTELIVEEDIPTIAHHHDFYWERDRYALSGADDYLRAAFPPTLRQIHHVVINSYARRQLALRTGASSNLIANVMDFDTPPPELDGFTDDLRAELNISPATHILLQPTRVVPRKRIELSIEFAKRIGLECVLVISHKSGDEGTEYERYLEELAHSLEVSMILAGDRFSPQRGSTIDGRKKYSLSDAYRQSDLVTYPSRVEGFGNAFLETIYFKRPIMMGAYEIFRTDIQPKGFKIVGFGEYIDENCIRTAREILLNPESAEAMTSHNFEIGRRHYSYRMLENQLASILRECLGMF